MALHANGDCDVVPALPTSAAGVPAELAFLVGAGVPVDELLRCARQAARLGVDPCRQLLASGLVDETSFYRAVARELDLPFCELVPALQPGPELGAALRHGLARVAKPDETSIRFFLSPDGPALRRLLQPGARRPHNVAIAPPTAFAAALRRAHSRTLPQRIAGGPRPDLDPRSACRGSSHGQLAFASCCVGPTAYFGTLAPLETVVLLALLAGPFFLAVIYLRLAAICEPPPQDLWRQYRWRVDDGRLPVYTVAVPLFREQRVLGKLIAALSALDYPAAKLDVRILVEEHDAGLRSALAERSLPPNFAVTVVPRGLPQTKPRALNLALIEARGELFTVYDAEDVPDPQQLRRAAARFLAAGADLACLQARLVVDNSADGALQALFALEYAGLFDVLNPGLLRLRLPIMLGGTSNHFRTEALRRLGGWDAWNVTEDADMGLRLARAGYRMDDLASITLEEAPHNMASWLKQRIRWNKGYVQTLITHLKQPATLVHEAGWIATCAFLALALGGVASSLVYPVFAIGFLVALLDGSLLALGKGYGDAATLLAGTVTLAGGLALILAPTLGAIRRGAPDLLKFVPLLPFYYGLVSYAAWLSLLEYVLSRHRWNKTEHGRARNSRYRAGATP